jgi:hypothetical protein
MFIYMYKCVYVCICMLICMYKCVFVCICMHIYMYKCVFVCVNVYIHVQMCVVCCVCVRACARVRVLRVEVHVLQVLVACAAEHSVAENIRNTLGTHWEPIGNTAAASQQNKNVY